MVCTSQKIVYNIQYPESNTCYNLGTGSTFPMGWGLVDDVGGAGWGVVSSIVTQSLDFRFLEVIGFSRK